VSDMYRTRSGKVNSELFLICTGYRVDGQIVNCFCYVQNIGWKGKE